jgi:hypothetical protein
MSCCGNPRLQAAGNSVSAAVGTRSVSAGARQQQPVSQQPTSHPGIVSPFPPPSDASSPFRPPDITPPPAAMYPMAHLNGAAFSLPPPLPPKSPPMMYGMRPSSPTAVQQMGVYSSASPIVDHNGYMAPLRRASLAYSSYGSSNSPNLLTAYQSPTTLSSLPPVDEGKVSVSIDFGERRPTTEPSPIPRRARN